MNYPYKKRLSELERGNERFGGKRICPINEEALAYQLLLMNCDRLLAPYVFIGMAHIYRGYKEGLAERESMLMQGIRYDRVQSGYVQYHGDYSAQETYIGRELDLLDKAEQRYKNELVPVLRVHKALMQNAATMFGYREPAGRMVEVAVYHSMTMPMARNEVPDKCVGHPSRTWTMIVRPRALAGKNKNGYLEFPLFTEQDISALSRACYQNLNQTVLNRFVSEEMICLSDLDQYRTGRRFTRDFSNRLRSECLGWSSWECIISIAEKIPDIEEALSIFESLRVNADFEAAKRKSFHFQSEEV